MPIFKIVLVFAVLVGGILWTVKVDVDGKHQQPKVPGVANAIS